MRVTSRNRRHLTPLRSYPRKMLRSKWLTRVAWTRSRITCGMSHQSMRVELLFGVCVSQIATLCNSFIRRNVQCVYAMSIRVKMTTRNSSGLQNCKSEWTCAHAILIKYFILLCDNIEACNLKERKKKRSVSLVAQGFCWSNKWEQISAAAVYMYIYIFSCPAANTQRVYIFNIPRPRRRDDDDARSREGRRGKVCIVQSEANVTKCAAADVPGRSCTRSQKRWFPVSVDGNIPRKSTYAVAASLQLSWQEERVAPRSLTFIVTWKWGRARPEVKSSRRTAAAIGIFDAESLRHGCVDWRMHVTRASDHVIASRRVSTLLPPLLFPSAFVNVIARIARGCCLDNTSRSIFHVNLV